MTDQLIVTKEIVINADASKVWEAITNPELTKKYMHNSEVISDWKSGSAILWRDAESGKVHVKGTIVNIELGKYLRTLDLSIDSGLPDKESNYSRVTYELNNEKGKTRLRITEDKFNSDEKRFNDSVKFWEVVLLGLKNLLEE